MRYSFVIDIKHLALKYLLITGMAVALMAAMQTNSISAEASVSIIPATKAISSEVCMVTDRVMGKPQIPVVIEGKTYYGCCEGCKAKLQKNRSIRYSTDPVTGKEVDKARAYIVQGDLSKALYFESEQTAIRYKNR
ncbi:hypothetical protein MNBD_DELTA01-384 [hydrothermal vent metagenome]|uniref:TRASH transcription regulator C-terminal archaeal domain-containing protein n=1 Tax=hydrothermal vent metagenome TaxID=652676 RepID=A0A3B0QZV1_9ZZZZ